jgi:aryl-alcohol dehydrogenase-like predicted oxidoreductase
VLDELGIGFVPYSPLGRGFLTGPAKPGGGSPPPIAHTGPMTSTASGADGAGAVRALEQAAHRVRGGLVETVVVVLSAYPRKPPQ